MQRLDFGEQVRKLLQAIDVSLARQIHHRFALVNYRTPVCVEVCDSGGPATMHRFSDRRRAHSTFQPKYTSTRLIWSPSNVMISVFRPLSPPRLVAS